MGKLSGVDTISGLTVTIAPNGAQTFAENAVYTGATSGLAGLIGGMMTGLLGQVNAASVAPRLNLGGLRTGGSISPTTLIIDLAIPGSTPQIPLVEGRLYMSGKGRQPKGSTAAKGFAISDAVIGFRLQGAAGATELLANLVPRSASATKPLSLQKVINRLQSKPGAIGALLGVESTYLSNPAVMGSLGAGLPSGLTSRDAVLAPAGAQGAFAGSWFDSGPVLA